MKKRLSFLLLSFLITFPACTKKEETAQPTAQAKEITKKESTLIYCSEGSPSGLNPQIVEDGTSFTATNPIYSTLLTIERGKTNVIPDLAEKWEVSKDQKQYTFHLRKDVKFHKTTDFTPTRNFNADDILFSFNRQRLDDHPYHKVSGGNYINFKAMNMKVISDIKKLDDYTVLFILQKPDAAFLANITMNFCSILSQEYADQLTKKGTPEKIDTNPVGTGPFIFKSYEKDSTIRYDSNPDYYGARKADVDKLIFVITPDPSVRAQKIRAGECQVIAEPPVVEYKSFMSDPNLKVVSLTGLNLSYLAFNTKKKPFDNILVRQAISHALNRAAYVDAIFQGLGQVAESAMPSSMWGYNSNLPTYDYNVDQAKELLKQAGYANGFATELWALPVSRPYNPDGRKMAEMMQADLAKIGITIKIVTYDWPTYLSKSLKGEHSMLQFGWSSDNGDPDNFLYMQLSCAGAEGGSNRAFWCYKPFDELVNKAKSVTDVAERTELYMDAQKIFKEQVPFIPIASSKVFRVMQKNVNGFVMTPLGFDFLDGVTIQ